MTTNKRLPLAVMAFVVMWIAGSHPYAMHGTPLRGTVKWVTILCRFADSTSVTPHPKSWFETLMGSSYPGMDHYWREQSYDAINFAGSIVVGWYNLPQPRSYYVFLNKVPFYDGTEHMKEYVHQDKLLNDCMAAADGDVLFPDYSNINITVNQDYGCCPMGGGRTLSRDGQTKLYGITWMPPAGYQSSPNVLNGQSTFAHEMGHSFGLHHSSGPYLIYSDSEWDVMSGQGRCRVRHPEYGCVGVHTIAYHKDSLGWIPPPRKYVATPRSHKTITLERLAQPTSSTDYLMAQIPIGGSTTQFYTVEARRSVGYDKEIPGEGIVIHKVDTTLNDRNAKVVDASNDLNPNDEGAMWTPGEAFADPANKVTISVDRATPSGYEVTISFGTSPDLAAALQTAIVPGTVMNVGAGFSVTDTTRNFGIDPAVLSTTGYRLSMDFRIPGNYTLIGSRSVPGLGPGQQSTAAATLTVPPTVAPGIYYLMVCADDKSVVVETDELNNCQVSPTTVQVTAPDLRVGFLSNPPASAARGTSFSVTDMTENHGDGPAGPSLTVYRLSTDQIIATSDYVIGNRSVPGLHIMSQQLFPPWKSGGTTTVTIFSMIPPGTYFLGACADEATVVAESDELNNCRIAATTIEVLGAADLIVSALSNPPASAVAGSSFSATDTTSNIGPDRAGASTTVYRLSIDQIITSADPVIGSRPVPTLGGSTISAGSGTVTVPLGLGSGLYYLGACADDANTVIETNETNNCRVTATPVQVQGAPDLVISKLSSQPVLLAAGGSFSVTDTTKNRSAEPAGPSTTAYLLMPKGQQVITSADPLLGSRPVPSLSGRAGSTATVTSTIPMAVDAGEYVLVACADDSKAVAESDETNNCRVSENAMVVKVEGPDLVVSALSKPPESAKAGTNFVVLDTTENIGSRPAGPSMTRYWLLSKEYTIATRELLIGSRPVPALSGKTSSSGTVTVTIPTTSDAGPYLLVACADDTRVVAESDGTNNCVGSAKIEVSR